MAVNHEVLKKTDKIFTDAKIISKDYQLSLLRERVCKYLEWNILKLIRKLDKG